jgi:hypothetical protein
VWRSLRDGPNNIMSIWSRGVRLDRPHTKLNIEEAVKRRVYVDDLLEELTVEELMEANTSKL